MILSYYYEKRLYQKGTALFVGVFTIFSIFQVSYTEASYRLGDYEFSSFEEFVWFVQHATPYTSSSFSNNTDVEVTTKKASVIQKNQQWCTATLNYKNHHTHTFGLSMVVYPIHIHLHHRKWIF